jgi:hypothetical protein
MTVKAQNDQIIRGIVNVVAVNVMKLDIFPTNATDAASVVGKKKRFLLNSCWNRDAALLAHRV